MEVSIGNIISLISAILSLFFGGTALYYRKEAKREKQLNNDSIVIKQMQTIINEKNDIISRLKTSIENLEEKLKLYDQRLLDKDSFYDKQITECRRILLDELKFEREHTKSVKDELTTTRKEKEDLLIEHTKDMIVKCLVKKCPNRTPPSDY